MAEPLNDAVIRIVPLGGLGEIGMNCMAIEQKDGILVVDCGTSFPFDDLGVDVFHPDLRWLIERVERISGIFLTHGHEDHIGGMPYLLDELDVPVWGPRHSLGLVRRRLAEHGFSPEQVELNEALAGARYAVGPFEVEPVRVSHSIVEATALRIHTRAGTILHSGDFNMDPNPPDGEPTNEARLREIGDDGVALLLSDSTNVDVPVRLGSERDVGRVLEQLVRESPARVFISMFASNVQRLILLGGIAERTGRKICLLGRSLLTQREVGEQIGRLRWPAGVTISPEQAVTWPRDELIVLAAGSQAETSSSMLRLANGTHHLLKIEPDDTVILSARAIPGNERPVFHMMMEILRRGARLHTRYSEPYLHTSGHAGQTEQKRMIDLLRPRSFLPIHGTLHHLIKHAELARTIGVSDALVVENGNAVELGSEGLRAGGSVPAGKVAIAEGGEPIGPDTLRRRADLGRSGVATISVALDRAGFVAAGPHVTTRGIPGVDEDADALRSVARVVARALVRARNLRPADVVEQVRRAARRELFELCGCRPVVEVHVLGPHD